MLLFGKDLKAKYSCLYIFILLVASPCFLCWALAAYGNYYANKAEKLIPEYDRLNDEVIKNIPLPSDAVLLPETLVRNGPWYNGLIDPYFDPRHLSICYATNENNIEEFYRVALPDANWKPTSDVFGAIYVQDHACIRVWETCHRDHFDEIVHPGYRTVYNVEIYHNLNVLLGFPGIPDGGCP